MGNLNKVVYTDHQTVITADNLNAIQDSVIQNTSYTTCDTSAGTAAKTAALTNFVLTTGSCVRVKFTNSNTADNPTLNINSTGAKALKKYGTDEYGTTSTTSWRAGAVLTFVYDGTNWVQLDYPTKLDALGIGATKYNIWDNSVSVLNVGSAYSGGNFRVNANTESYPSDLPGTVSPAITSTAFVAYRQSFMQQESTLYHAIVVLYEIYPVSGRIWINSYNTSWRGWRAVAFTDNTVPKSGGTFTGTVRVDSANGTTSTMGGSEVSIGNAIPTGTAGNSRGYLSLYSPQTYWTTLYSADTQTANRHIKLPDASGTIALQDVVNKSSNSFFTPSSGFTVSSKYWYQTGKVVYIYLNIKKTDSSVLASSRINAGTLASGYRPMAAVAQMVPSSNGVDSYMNRQTAVVIQADGIIYLDNYYASDVKTVYLRMSFVLP